MLFASTCCVYGNPSGAHRVPSQEADELHPTEVYACSKAAAERVVLSAGPPHIVMRLATFYGPTMRKELAAAVFLRQALSGESITIHGDGLQTRTLTHVDDIVTGIVTLLQSPSYCWQPVFNISAEISYSVLELAHLIRKVTRRSVDIVHIDDRPGQIRSEAIDCSRLRNLGWSPVVPLVQGLLDCYQALEPATTTT